MKDFLSPYPEIPHRSGNNPAAMNVLWADSHVTACTTKVAFDPALWGRPGNIDTPNHNASQFQKSFRYSNHANLEDVNILPEQPLVDADLSPQEV